MPSTEAPIDPDILELVPRFCTARRGDIETIAKHLETGDLAAVQRLCHTIKGIARPYGFPTLEDYARKLEDAAKAKDLSAAQQVFSEMRTYFEPYASNRENFMSGPEMTH